MTAARWRFVAPDPPHDVPTPREPATFSVVIPAYQAAAFVLEAVTSVLEQTLPPREVIVVDDGSTDGTAQALTSVADRITIVQQAHGGLSRAKNNGLSRASGDFVTFLDADDVFYPERFEALSELSRIRPDLDILTTDLYVTSQGKRLRLFNSDANPFAVADQELEILRRCFVFANAAARRELLASIGGFDESFPRANDWDGWIRLIHAGARVGMITAPLGEYRQTPGSLTSNRAESLRDRVVVLEKALTGAPVGSTKHVTIIAELASVRERTRREDAKVAVLSGRKARRRSAAVAFGRNTSTRNRVRALLAVVAPRIARHRLEARQP